MRRNQTPPRASIHDSIPLSKHQPTTRRTRERAEGLADVAGVPRVVAEPRDAPVRGDFAPGHLPDAEVDQLGEEPGVEGPCCGGLAIDVVVVVAVVGGWGHGGWNWAWKHDVSEPVGERAKGGASRRSMRRVSCRALPVGQVGELGRLRVGLAVHAHTRFHGTPRAWNKWRTHAVS